MSANGRLGDVAAFVRGVTFKPTDVVPVGSAGTVACMRTKNVQSTLDLADVWAIDRDLVRRDEQFLREGDILVSSANSSNLVGKCCWVPALAADATFGGFVSVLRPTSHRVDARYLYLWMASGRTQAALRGAARQTTNIANLSTERVLNLQLPLPSLDEQRRIAAVFDRLGGVGARCGTRSDTLVQLVGSVFNETVGDPVTNPRRWGVRALETLLASRPQIGTTRAATSTGRVPVVRIGELGRELPDLEACGRVDLDPAAADALRLAEGDVLLARAVGSESHIGKASVCPPLDAAVVFDSHVMRLRLDQQRLRPMFLWHWLRSPGGRRRFMRVARRTAIQYNVNADGIRRLEVPLPPASVQDEFLAIARRIARTGAGSANVAELAARLFSNISDRVFVGGR